MQQNGFHNDADAAQQEKHDGQLLQPLSAEVRGEEPGQRGGAEGGGQRDKAEAQGGAGSKRRCMVALDEDTGETQDTARCRAVL